jgi:FkbM family methyltransferase
MHMVSYSQNFEDVLLNRVFSGKHDGFYIDVGASDPVYMSVTKHFYDHGWHGINVEPGRVAFERLRAERPRDINLNFGVSSSTGTLTFFEAAEHEGGISTFSRRQAEGSRAAGHALNERATSVRTLGEICEEYVSGEIDFLSVDVEGLEREVLEGADWSRWRPKVLLVEAVTPVSFTPCHQDWEPILLEAEYLFALFDGLNRFYVRQEDRHLLDLMCIPANATDNFVSYHHMHRYSLLVGGVETLQAGVIRDLAAISGRFPRTSSAVQRALRRATRKRR